MKVAQLFLIYERVVAHKDDGLVIKDAIEVFEQLLMNERGINMGILRSA